MGEVIPLRKKQLRYRGHVRQLVTESLGEIPKPVASVIITLGADGCFSLRSMHTDAIADFDVYSRCAAILDQEKMDLLRG